jgi:hypothetical protein
LGVFVAKLSSMSSISIAFVSGSDRLGPFEKPLSRSLPNGNGAGFDLAPLAFFSLVVSESSAVLSELSLNKERWGLADLDRLLDLVLDDA